MLNTKSSWFDMFKPASCTLDESDIKSIGRLFIMDTCDMSSWSTLILTDCDICSIVESKLILCIVKLFIVTFEFLLIRKLEVDCVKLHVSIMIMLSKFTKNNSDPELLIISSKTLFLIIKVDEVILKLTELLTMPSITLLNISTSDKNILIMVLWLNMWTEFCSLRDDDMTWNNASSRDSDNVTTPLLL